MKLLYIILTVSAVYLGIGCAVRQNTTIVGSPRLVGADVSLDGVVIGKLPQKRVIEFVTFDGAVPSIVRTRLIAKFVLTGVSPGYHTLMIKQSGVTLCSRFKQGQHLIDLDELSPSNRSKSQMDKGQERDRLLLIAARRDTQLDS